MAFDIRRPAITQIEDIVADIPGWTPIDQLYTLYTLGCASAPLGGDILEIGSWCGRSTAILGEAARFAGNTRICSIDLFPAKSDWWQNADGSYSFKVVIDGKSYGGYEDQTVWQEPFERDIAPLYAKHDGILNIFRETMRKRRLKISSMPTRLIPTFSPRCPGVASG